jgi:DNA-binding XRE family transcriptional regulator
MLVGINRRPGNTEKPTSQTQLRNMNKKMPHHHLYSCLGEVITSRRKRLKMSQEQLAETSGVDRSFISNVEGGRRNPSFGIVAHIAQGLKLRYSRLVAKCEQCQIEHGKTA